MRKIKEFFCFLQNLPILINTKGLKFSGPPDFSNFFERKNSTIFFFPFSKKSENKSENTSVKDFGVEFFAVEDIDINVQIDG